MGAIAAPAGAQSLAASPPAALSYASRLTLSGHSASVRVRCRHSVPCAGHVVLQLIGRDGALAGKVVDTESRYIALDPGRARVAVLRFSTRARQLLATGHSLTVSVTLKAA